MKIVAVVQARMGSTRLPGKVLRDLGGRAAIWWAIQAGAWAPGVDEVVVATSTNPENDIIASNLQHIRVIRGSEDDVLDRYRLVVQETGADAVVRLTADCPLLDSRVIGEVVALWKHSGCAYASNIDPPTWPDGLDCEVISAEAIIVAAEEATRATDRDTVTRYIARNRAKFPAKTLICPLPGLQKERWVLDSPEDYEFIQAVFDNFHSGWQPNYLDILDLLKRKPLLRMLTGPYTRNQRFFESLSVEKHIRKDFSTSKRIFDHAKELIPFASQTFSKSHLQYLPGGPLFLSHGDGGYAFDVDGNDYVDMVSALLPNVLGYCDPDVDYAIREQLSSGISFSLATVLETQLSERLSLYIPCAEMVKFGKNGSDVTSAAVRVARAFTGRKPILSLIGGYHGWHDWAVIHTERATGATGLDSSKRIESSLARIERSVAKGIYGALIVEPEGKSQAFLAALREITEKHGTVLIFDEVITGFRWHIGGYQQHIGVTPDLATFGKAMANGMPLSALVGRKDIMKRFEPPDNVFYSGTFFGEALSLAASIATIDKIQDDHVIPHLWTTGEKLRQEVNKRILARDLDDVIRLSGDGPLIRLFFRGRGGFADNVIAGLFRKWMMESGTLIISSHNICYAHGPAEIARVLASYDYALDNLSQALQSAVPDITGVARGVR